MKSHWRVFNFFLVLAVTLAIAGCSTLEERKKKRDYSNIRVHVEKRRRKTAYLKRKAKAAKAKKPKKA